MTRMYWMRKSNSIVIISPGEPASFLWLSNPFTNMWTSNKWIGFAHIQRAVKNKNAILVSTWK